MPVSGTAEILHEMFANRNKKLLNVCNLRLNDQWPYHEDAPYVQEIETKFQCSLRCVHWEDNLDYLDDICNRYAPTQDIWFATYREQTFKAMAKLQNCKTISINYGPESYKLVCHLWANYQTGKLLSKQIVKDTPNDIYQRFLEQGPEAFGYSIPQKKHHPADVEINIEDLYKQQSFEKILIELDCICTANDWIFYQTYVDKILQVWRRG
jgi:hypothetical protein